MTPTAALLNDHDHNHDHDRGHSRVPSTHPTLAQSVPPLRHHGNL